MTTDAITVTPAHAVTTILACIRAKQPVFLSGGPGIGKSDIFKSISDTMFAAEYGYHVDLEDGKLINAEGVAIVDRPWYRDVRPALRDPVDFAGMPHLENGKLRFAPSSIFPDCGTGLLFFDELNRAPTMTQNAAFQIILDRRSGDYILPDGWVVSAAGNRESDGGGVMRMPQALSNRFLHVNLEADLEDWCKWANTHDINPMVIAFLRFRDNLLYAFSQTEHAFPTPRSWSFVSRILGNHAPDIERVLVAGAVGQAAAVEFISFVQIYRNAPNIDFIIANPESAPVPTDIATLYAVSAALASRVTIENIDAVMTYLDRIPTEYAVYTIKDGFVRNPLIASTTAFSQWAIGNSDVI